MPARRPAKKILARPVVRKARARATEAADGSKTISRQKRQLTAAAAALEARRRFAKNGEKPTNPEDRYYIMKATQTRKRSASRAWDDKYQPPKKSKTDIEAEEAETHDKAQEKKMALRSANGKSPAEKKKKSAQNDASLDKSSQDKSPEGDKKGAKGKKRASLPARNWQNDSTLEQPRSPSDLPIVLNPAGSTNDPNKNLGYFGIIPTELRDEILREVLVWPENILVFRGWSIVYPRTRISLAVAVLRTCRMLHYQGLRILFGENTFEYDLRDPCNGHTHTMAVIDKVFDKSHIKINHFGHLIRSIKIKLNRNRMGDPDQKQNFEQAIFKFLPGGGLRIPPNLHTLTLDVPAETMKDLLVNGWRSNPNGIPVADMLNNKNKRILNGLLEMKVRYIRLLARRKIGRDVHPLHISHWIPSVLPPNLELYEAIIDCKYLVKDRLLQARQKAHGSGSILPKDVEVKQQQHVAGVNTAKARIMNIAWRIQGLTVNPDEAIKQGLWTPVDDTNTSRRSLPSPDRGTNQSTCSSVGPTASSSIKNKTTPVKHTAAPRYGPNAVATKGTKSTTPRDSLIVKLRYTPRTHISEVPALAKASRPFSSILPASSSILGVGNAANDARLLRAQQGTIEEGGPSNRGGMLTADFLEGNAEPNAEYDTSKSKGKGKAALRYPDPSNEHSES
ncbi:hypothetical protein F5Y18DRAFT_438957 [Xylariaceae sp. FL1019]|nr:hypothetical protein F5Y18DRAFT_438957 [Xylariaceae sp. FL1019]